MQGHHFSLLQHETEKLKGDIEKMRGELRSGQANASNIYLKVRCMFDVYLLNLSVLSSHYKS